MECRRFIRMRRPMCRLLQAPPSPPDTELARWWLFLCVPVWLSLGVMPAGCALPRRTVEPECDPTKLDDLRFVHYLATAPTVTVAEGVRGVLLLTGPTSRWPAFEDQRAELERLGAFRQRWGLDADETLDKGTLAFMLRGICRLPRSATEILASATSCGERRYALKTCVDRGLLSYGLPQDPVAGGEVLSALTRAEQILGDPRVYQSEAP